MPTQPDLSTLIQTDMNVPLPSDIVTSILSSPPFIPIPYVLNFRDLGLLPSSPIPPNLILRSGTLPQSLAPLKISMILDLRSERKVKASPDPEGSVWVSASRAPKPVEMGMFVEDGGVRGYKEMYMEVLEIYESSWRRGLEWLLTRKHGDGGMIVHCTAGKDRTGVFAALLLSLAGAPRSLIAYDYALTRFGVEPSREVLTQMLRLWNKEWKSDTRGMAEFVQVKGEFIVAFLDVVDERYGGVEAYVRNVLGFGEEDLLIMKAVLRDEGKL